MAYGGQCRWHWSPCVCLQNLWVMFWGNFSSYYCMLWPHPFGQLGLNTVMVIRGSNLVLPIYGEC